MGTAGGGDSVYQMCTKALQLGYRHFDTVRHNDFTRSYPPPRH